MFIFLFAIITSIISTIVIIIVTPQSSLQYRISKLRSRQHEHKHARILLPAAASWIPKLHPCALYPNTLCLVGLIILGLGRVNLVQKPGANHTLLVVAT